MSRQSASVAFNPLGRPEADRRAESRARKVLALGKLSFSGHEQVCSVRDISPSGVGVESRRLPFPGQHVRIEMRGLAPSVATVVWRDPGKCGLAFEAEQDVDAVFCARGSASRKRPRCPRFALDATAQVLFRIGASNVNVVDISAGGLKLRGETDAQVGSYGVVRMNGFADELRGYVAWKRGEMLGLHFDRPLSRDDLFDILSYAILGGSR